MKLQLSKNLLKPVLFIMVNFDAKALKEVNAKKTRAYLFGLSSLGPTK